MFDPEALDPAVVLEEAERYERLRQLVGGLTEEKREVLRLVYESEMNISSAAGALGVPEGTVKSRLHSARKQLAREWEAWERGSR
jgi:RNA polymerase sigma-70 factor (ECF subfamily)